MGAWGEVGVGVLRCPVCGGTLHPGGAAAARCAEGHTFDVARQGYVNLLTGKSTVTGDTAAMVASRTAFLAAGHYDRLTAALAEAAARVDPAPGSVILDAGTGTGHYLARVLDAVPTARGLGLDASKFAARKAAKAHPRAAAAVWDLRRPLPVPTGSVALVLNVFAPRNGAEFHRVLAPGGALLVVTPTTRHLAELRAALPILSVDEAKEERVGRSLDPYFDRESSQVLEYTGELALADVERLVAMGPSAHHVADLPALVAALDPPVEVTFAFRLTTYRPRRAVPSDSSAG